jgi:hypothetical protein
MVPSCDLQVIRVFRTSGYRKKRRSDINYHGGKMIKIKNVQSIICLVIFFLFANQAWAADWIYYDTAAVGDMLYYDKNSIKKENESIISVWAKNILSEETKTRYVSILKGIHKAPKNPSRLSYYTKLTEIDCVNKKMKVISAIFYDKKGKVVYSSPKSESGEWNDILPNTVGEKLIKIVSCESVTSNEAVVAPTVEEPVPPNEAAAAPSPIFAAYSGHVASFKSEDNAVKFVNKMKAKGLVAFYQKEDVSGDGAFYRSYIGRYKTIPLARKALIKLKKAGEIDFFQIKKTAGKDGRIVTTEMELGAQKNEPSQKTKNKTVPSIDTRNYYKGINGIVLKNGKVVNGQIISVYNDVLKIRTKHGKILSYSFMKVKEYITE